MKSKARVPRQERSRGTVSAILESAIHILEKEGLEGLKVAALVERAGYGIGTLYQYFPNIDAVMRELVKMQSEKQWQVFLAGFSDLAAKGEAVSTLRVVQLFLHALDKRLGAQKAMLDWILARPNVRELENRLTVFAQLLASVSIRSQRLQFERLLSETELFVLSRAVFLPMRSAIWSGSPIFNTPQFEQSLADVVDGYMYRLAQREQAKDSK